MGRAILIIHSIARRQKIELRKDEPVTFGRRKPSTYQVLEDPLLSDVHLSLVWDGSHCTLHGFENSVTFVDGAKVSEAVLRPGAEIMSGRTWFSLRSEEAETPAAGIAKGPELWQDSTLSPSKRGLLNSLATQRDPLFALLDAARDPRMLSLLHESREEFQSLYAGSSAEELGMFAPYLVRLFGNSLLLKELVTKGWGQSWGVYVTCPGSLQEVRKHFRRFLIAALEEGKKVYFRFYDPRVLRSFLPTFTPEQVKEFFGSITSFLVESEDTRTLLRYSLQGEGTRMEKIDLEAPGEGANTFMAAR